MWVWESPSSPQISPLTYVLVVYCCQNSNIAWLKMTAVVLFFTFRGLAVWRVDIWMNEASLSLSKDWTPRSLACYFPRSFYIGSVRWFFCGSHTVSPWSWNRAVDRAWVVSVTHRSDWPLGKDIEAGAALSGGGKWSIISSLFPSFSWSLRLMSPHGLSSKVAGHRTLWLKDVRPSYRLRPWNNFGITAPAFCQLKEVTVLAQIQSPSEWHKGRKIGWCVWFIWGHFGHQLT